MESESRNETEKRVYSGLSEGARVRFEQNAFPPFGVQREGEITEVNEDPPCSVWTKYKVENESGYWWVAANDVCEVVDRAV